MPTWIASTASKMLHSLSNANVPSQPRQRKTSIDVHVHTQRSFFVEPAAVTARECGHVGHRYRLRPPYAVPPKYEKEFARPRPKPLKIRTDENVFAVDEKEKEKGKGNGLVDRRRRYGMMCYPDGVREELRRTRSRSPRLAKLDVNAPSPRFMDTTPSPQLKSRKSNGAESPSVYSDGSGYGEQITVSSAKAEIHFEPPSWFSDHSRSESSRSSRHTRHTSEISTSDMQRILSFAAEHSPKELEPSSAHVPSTAKSWETFRVPSIPPSPVESTSSSEAVPVPPRDPRLPPADYLLYKDMYDDAMIGLHGKLPAEWVAYSHRHYTGPSRI